MFRGHAGFDHGDFTLVEHPERGNGGLAVRPVPDAQQQTVRRFGGYLFPSVAAAEEFARRQMLFDSGPPIVRYGFCGKRVDGLRIYVYRGS
jgi:hypothetical protein